MGLLALLLVEAVWAFDCTPCYPNTHGPCQQANTVCWALNPNGQCPPGTFLCSGASSTTTTTTTAAPSSTTTSTTTTAAPSSTTTSTTKSTLPPSTTTQTPSTTSTVSSPGVPVCPGTLLSAWNSCSQPSQYNCCPAGYGCYRQDQWYSQCVLVGQCHFSDCTCLGSACLGGTVSTTTAPTSTTSTTSTSTAPTSTTTSTSTAAGTTTSSKASTTTSTTTSAPATSSTTTSAPTSSISTTASTPATTGPANPGTAAQVLAVYDTTSPVTILTSQRPDLSWGPSKVYKWEDFLKAAKNMYETGVGASKLWLGDGSANGITYGVVNLAAFLAQSMKETIQYDVCDENNWDQTSGYAATNACGQLGQSYQDYHCPPGEEHMECPLDPTMTIRAATSATWYGAPPPMFCAPKSKLPATPKWNYGSPWCDPNVVRDYDMTPDEYIAYLKDPSKKCADYPGQKAGGFEWCGSAGCPNNAAPAFGQPARTNLENCCWWGRGVIQTTGVCNFGKMNYFMGAAAAARGVPNVAFPDINFCKEPDAICTSTEHPELKWVAGLFYWINSVQTYDVGGWNYLNELKAWVDAGLPNLGSDSGFIHAVSGIVNRGCHNPPCGSGALDGGAARAKNFQTVLKATGLF